MILLPLQALIVWIAVVAYLGIEEHGETVREVDRLRMDVSGDLITLERHEVLCGIRDKHTSCVNLSTIRASTRNLKWSSIQRYSTSYMGYLGLAQARLVLLPYPIDHGDLGDGNGGDVGRDVGGGRDEGLATEPPTFPNGRDFNFTADCAEVSEK